MGFYDKKTKKKYFEIGEDFFSWFDFRFLD
jgi:hypothetical protein